MNIKRRENTERQVVLEWDRRETEWDSRRGTGEGQSGILDVGQAKTEWDLRRGTERDFRRGSHLVFLAVPRCKTSCKTWDKTSDPEGHLCRWRGTDGLSHV